MPLDSGYRSIEWCADFARYAWQQAGVDISGLNADSSSFEKSAAGYTWHPIGDGYVPQPGDVADFGSAHTAIVVAGGSNPEVVNGDWDHPQDGQPIVAPPETVSSTASGAGTALTGYTSPSA